MLASFTATQAQTPTITTEIPRRTETPDLDGNLEESVWCQAGALEDLRQVEPLPGQPGTSPTRVYLFHNGLTLYVGVEALDHDPEKVIARQLKRDADQAGDDRFVLTLDSLGDRRSGFQFGINPLGARTDALIAGHNLNDDWDGIWTGRARKTDSGWTAELAIPFATLPFRDDGRPWGLNFERVVARRNETVRWAAASRNQRVYYLGSAGRVSGLDNLDVGLGIDFRPFAKAEWNHGGMPADTHDFEGGFDVFWRLAPTVSAALTINTDFSETEVDDRLINLTRFPTFFPEKRAFFLEDAGVFEFGGLTPGFGGLTSGLLPYFSRRIGLDSRGREVDLRTGLKSTGRMGPFSFGLIGAQTSDDDGNHNLGVLRGRFDFFDESTAGFMFTRGSPANTDSDWLGGVDLNLQTSRWRNDRTIRVNAYALRSHDASTRDTGGAFGLGFRYPTDQISITTDFSRIDESFNPALGYVRQTGIYHVSSKVILRWRPDGLDRIDWGTAVDYVSDLDGGLDYFEASIFDFTIMNKARDNVGASWFVYREAIDEPLSIGPGVIVPVGVHDTGRLSAWIGTGPSRPLQFDTEVSYGGLYNGDSLQIETAAGVQTSPHLHAFVEHQFVSAHLPQGDFDVHNLRLRGDVLLNPDLAISMVAGWDSLSDDLGFNLRLRWTIEPGRDLFVVFNQSVDTLSGWRPVNSGVSTKAAWTFRF